MQLKKREAEQIFDKLRIARKGTKHIHGWFTHEGRRILFAHFSHRKGDMPGNVPDKFRQSLKLDKEQFRLLKDCPIDRERYIEILKEKRHIEEEENTEGPKH